jgi:hypothetical protein
VSGLGGVSKTPPLHGIYPLGRTQTCPQGEAYVGTTAPWATMRRFPGSASRGGVAFLPRFASVQSDGEYHKTGQVPYDSSTT